MDVRMLRVMALMVDNSWGPNSFPSIRQLIDAAGPIVYLWRAGGFPRNARLPQPVYFLASCGTGEASGTNM